MTEREVMADLVRFVGVITYGKERWFKQNGCWYDRLFGDYIQNETLLDRLIEAIEDEVSCDSADRPTGEVDAVAIYEKAEHDLEHGRITLGEFEKRIEPLKHLRYDRPTGEWVKDDLGSVICSECKGYRRDNRVSHTNFCNRCGAKMGGEEE